MLWTWIALLWIRIALLGLHHLHSNILFPKKLIHFKFNIWFLLMRRDWESWCKNQKNDKKYIRGADKMRIFGTIDMVITTYARCKTGGSYQKCHHFRPFRPSDPPPGAPAPPKPRGDWVQYLKKSCEILGFSIMMGISKMKSVFLLWPAKPPPLPMV